MGNVWGRRHSQVALEAEEERPSGSIEMKGSSFGDAAYSSSSLSSWPICLPNRLVSRAAADPATSQTLSQEEATSSRGESSRHDWRPENQSLREGSEVLCCIDSDSSSGACCSGEQEYRELKLTLKIPCTSANEALRGHSEEELVVMERQRQAAVRALASKAQECESLVEVVRELTKSRNKLMSTKSIQGERIADLQHDFMRVSHIADLSRALSRENIAKAAHLGHCLNQAEEELARQRIATQQLKEQYLKLKLENTDLRGKLGVIERLDVLAFRRESACLVEFQQLHLKETY